jgi:26S proteasome regulatory subunit N12
LIVVLSTREAAGAITAGSVTPLAMAANVKAAATQLDKFKKQIKAKQYDGALATLSELKIMVTGFPSLPPLGKESSTQKQELMIARDMLEHSVLLSADMKVRTLGV